MKEDEDSHHVSGSVPVDSDAGVPDPRKAAPHRDAALQQALDPRASLQEQLSTLTRIARGEIELPPSSDEDSDADEVIAGASAGLAAVADDEAEGAEAQSSSIPRGEATHRLALVNCDWDRLGARDILAVLKSFVPPGGVVRRVAVYPSKYGLERMAEEAVAGPQGIWKATKREWMDRDGTRRKVRPGAAEGDHEEDGDKSRDDGEQEEDEGEDAESSSSDEDNDDAFDPEKLREYELNKLKYYFAVIECDSVHTANHLYEECDGMEVEVRLGCAMRTGRTARAPEDSVCVRFMWVFLVQASSNHMDLRFIPDDTEFTHADPRDVADHIGEEYQAPLFYTQALQVCSVVQYHCRLYWVSSCANSLGGVHLCACLPWQSTRVDLSWEGDDPARARALQRRPKANKPKTKLRRHQSQADEAADALGLNEEAYRPYLASSNSESESSVTDSENELDNGKEEEDDHGSHRGKKPKMTKAERREAKRQKYLALLGGLGMPGDQPVQDDKEDDVLEVTFQPGLEQKLKKKQEERESKAKETVWDTFLREKKEKKKERRKNAQSELDARQSIRAAMAEGKSGARAEALEHGASGLGK